LYRESVDRSRAEVADSVEVPRGGVDAVLDRPTGMDTGSVARELNCSRRWVTTLCRTGQLAGTRVGREWRIDLDSVEDFKQRGVEAA
jgi:excisionase family DNA binding protein